MHPELRVPIVVNEKGECYANDRAKPVVACPEQLKAKDYAEHCADRLVTRRGEECPCEVDGSAPYVGKVPCPNRPSASDIVNEIDRPEREPVTGSPKPSVQPPLQAAGSTSTARLRRARSPSASRSNRPTTTPR